MKLPVLLFVCLSCLISWGQSPEKAILSFKVSAHTMGVTPRGSLVIMTENGEVAFADSIQDYWRTEDIAAKLGREADLGSRLENLTFFNRDTGFVSGFSYGRNKSNIIYHTANGGRSWKEVDFGQDGPVDDATQLDDGEAWLSVAGSGIAYTKDFGLTWTKLSIPDVKERFAAMFFNTEREGIIGSLWNTIACTGDNCQTWKKIPTPLDQKKYHKTDLHSRPEINRVAIFGDYLLVIQENLVFYTKRDSINWVWLPDYTNFYTDAANKGLYFMTSKRELIHMDRQLKPLFRSNRSVGPSLHILCSDGKLYILGIDTVLQFNEQGFVSSSLYTRGSGEGTPAIAGYSNNYIYGTIGNRVYKRSYEGNWTYQYTHPFTLHGEKIFFPNDSLLIYQTREDSLYYFYASDGRVKATTLQHVINDFCEAGIEQIEFAKINSGCFYYSLDKAIYIRRDGSFVLDDVRSQGDRQTKQLTNCPAEIDEDVLDRFVKELPLLVSKKATIEDLGFSDRQYAKCKRDILAFRRSIEAGEKEKVTPFHLFKNNLDFPRLLTLVDSVRYVDKAALDHVLNNPYEIISTSSTTVNLQLVNSRGEKLTLLHNYSEGPSAYYFPWTMSLDGLRLQSTAIGIYDFMRTAYPAFLNSPDKMPILYAIVKQMYLGDVSTVW